MKFTRRKFLSTSTSLVAGGSLIGCSNPKTSTKSAEQNTLTAAKAVTHNSKSIGVALLGLGNYSENLLAPALQATQHCHLAGIVTGTPSKIPMWQGKYGIKDQNVYNYGNLHEIANNDEIDVVYIVVPTGLHSKYAVIAANAGKHVWCEKPMAMNTSQCQEIIDACKKNKVKLSIGYRMLHEPNTQRLIANLDKMPFGAIDSVIANAGYGGGKPSGWRANKALGGGAMYDMGVYAVNGIRYATGQYPLSVLSAEHIIDRPDFYVEVDETTVFELEFESGIKVNGLGSVGKNINGLRVDCKNGWYSTTPMQSYNGVQYEDSTGYKMDAIPGMQQTLQMDNDALAILNNTAVIAPGEEGKKDIHIIEAIFKSAATEERIVL